MFLPDPDLGDVPLAPTLITGVVVGYQPTQRYPYIVAIDYMKGDSSAKGRQANKFTYAEEELTPVPPRLRRLRKGRP
jgi:hypothetical protein